MQTHPTGKFFIEVLDLAAHKASWVGSELIFSMFLLHSVAEGLTGNRNIGCSMVKDLVFTFYHLRELIDMCEITIRWHRVD